MSDFIKSDFCTECEGEGFVWLRHEQGDNDKEQCAECEELARLEYKADLAHEIAKGH